VLSFFIIYRLDINSIATITDKHYTGSYEIAVCW